MRLRVIITNCTDPYRNLAAEEYLTMNAEPGMVTLFLWQNERTVVIGKNQNPWRECDVEAINRDGIRLARRISGGGAVYHDLGNLNFTFIARDDLFDIPKQTDVILHACRQLGADVEKTGRNDLTIGGKKFSGHAYYSSGGCNYHHGTIMMAVNEDDLAAYLKVPDSKLRSKGVGSVRSRVTNLNDHIAESKIEEIFAKAGITEAASAEDRRAAVTDAIEKALINAATEEYGAEPEYSELPETPAELVAKYSSEEWRLGTRIPFEKEIMHRFEWGEVQALLSMKGGYISDCRIYSDSLETEIFDEIAALLKGCKYDPEAIRECGRGRSSVTSSPKTEEILEMIAG